MPRITNAELARRVDAVLERLERLDDIAESLADLRAVLEVMKVRVQELETRVDRHERVLFGENGGRKVAGIVDDLREVRHTVLATQKAISRIVWAVILSVVGGIGTWLANLMLGR